jgi:alpha/beta superfamily hydrolase
VAATWADATVTVVPGADHFLAGATDRVADEVLAWIERR